MVITLCGSSKFKDYFFSVAKELTLQGHIVLMPGVFHHSDNDELTTEQKIQLDNLHRQKINMSDAIFVINPGQYIGESTFGEIDWANKMGKQVLVLEQPPEEETSRDDGEVVEAE